MELFRVVVVGEGTPLLGYGTEKWKLKRRALDLDHMGHVLTDNIRATAEDGVEGKLALRRWCNGELGVTQFLLNLLKGKPRIQLRSKWEVASLGSVGRVVLPNVKRKVYHVAHLVISDHSLAVGVCAPQVFVGAVGMVKRAKATDRQARSEREERMGLLVDIAFVALCALMDHKLHPAGAVALEDIRPEYAKRRIENVKLLTY